MQSAPRGRFLPLAESMVALGFKVFPLRGKIPLKDTNGHLEATDDAAQLVAWAALEPNANVGIACMASNLLVIDVDYRVKEGVPVTGDTTFTDLERRYGKLPDTPRVLTGSRDGSFHLYFKPWPGLERTVPALGPGVEVKFQGYIVAPGSVHPVSGLEYLWETGYAVGELPYADVPIIWRNIIGKAARVAPDGGPSSSAEDSFFGRCFKRMGWWLGDNRVQCPWEDGHSMGERGDGSTILFPPGNGQVYGHVHCSHGHCANYTYLDVFDAIPELVLAAVKKETGTKLPRKARVQLREEASAAPEPVDDEAAVETLITAEGWRAELTYNDKRQLKPDKHNLTLHLLHDAAWDGCLGWDLLAHEAVWLRAPIWLEGRIAPTAGEPLGDEHYGYVAQWAATTLRLTMKTGTIAEAVMEAAKQRRFHPIRDYLDGLTWDETPRVATWLTTYFGAVEVPHYTAPVGIAFLVAMVARAYRPGCKFDTMVVLEGTQGAKKSQALQALAEPWYVETLPDLGNRKEAIMQLRRGWLCEIAELSAIRSREVERVKDFLSATQDTYSPKYARNAVTVPRLCVFVGTTNEATYLQDSTGNRRFLPVAVRQCDAAALRRDRDQLLAEAVQLWREGTPWWFEPGSTVWEVAAHEAERRREVDPWEDTLARALEGRTSMRMEDVYDALKLDVSRRDAQAGRRAGRILARLGYSKRHTRDGNVWEWREKESP